MKPYRLVNDSLIMISRTTASLIAEKTRDLANTPFHLLGRDEA
jgi:hypothetical protein